MKRLVTILITVTLLCVAMPSTGKTTPSLVAELSVNTLAKEFLDNAPRQLGGALLRYVEDLEKKYKNAPPATLEAVELKFG
jgi:hypothetical protein